MCGRLSVVAHFIILTNGCADDKFQRHAPPPPHFNNRGTQKIDLSEKGGKAMVNIALIILCSSRAPVEVNPHSGSVYPPRGCLCHEEMRGGTPDNRGARKVRPISCSIYKF